MPFTACFDDKTETLSAGQTWQKTNDNIDEWAGKNASATVEGTLTPFVVDGGWSVTFEVKAKTE